MSHDSHHEEDNHSPEIDITKSKPAFSASFWFMLILAGLFIAALNFVNVMGHDEGHGDAHGTHTEATHESGHGAEAAGHGEATHEAHEAAPAAEPAHEGEAPKEEHAEHH